MKLDLNRRYLASSRRAAACSAYLLMAGASLSGTAHAQTAPETAHPATRVQARRKIIPVRNVSASIMAWWLDPARHDKPIQFQSSLRNREANPLIVDKADPQREIPPLPAGIDPGLPTGIDQIVAIDPQNALLVLGTGAAIAMLEKTVAIFDKPIQQIEIDAQFVQISREDALQIGVLVSSDPKKRYSVSPLSNNDLARFAALKASGKTIIVSEPHVIAISSLTGAVGTQSRTAGFVDIKMRGEAPLGAVDLSEMGGQLLGVESQSTFTVRPTLNADNSIGLELAPARFLQLSELQTGPAFGLGTPAGINPNSLRAQVAKEKRPAVLPLRVLQGALTETTVQDGQTIALSGFTSDFFADFVTTAAEPAANVVILVTTRIVRRAADPVQTVALNR